MGGAGIDAFENVAFVAPPTGILRPYIFPANRGELTSTKKGSYHFAYLSDQFIYQDDVFGDTSQSGLSDVVQSVFLSPKAPTSSGWIQGAGPVFLLPTATDDLLGTVTASMSARNTTLRSPAVERIGVRA